MNDYDLLFQCYNSGQISERQWQEHLQDEGFKDWLITYYATSPKPMGCAIQLARTIDKWIKPYCKYYRGKGE